MTGSVVAVIPARGGSKGIPRKNLMDFCGAPLLVWSIRQAVAAASVDAVYVSSDDAEILTAATAAGAHPIERPAEISGDTASSESALLHALDHIEEAHGPVDLLVFLQCTSPLREPADIDAAVRQLRRDGADSLMSVARLEDFFLWGEGPNGFETLNFDNLNRPRRQEVKAQFLETGSIYVCKPDVLRRHRVRVAGRISAFEMPFWKWYEIDTLEAKEIAEWYFRTRLLAKQAQRPTPSDIDLVVWDFDGVMTNNHVVTFQDGTEAIEVSRADGLGVGMLREARVRQCILSTETNPVVGTRAGKLRIPCIQGAPDKAQALLELCRAEGTRPERVLYVGNDVNDLEAMRLVGWPVAPGDANPLVQRAARIVLRARGGQGVALEVAGMMLGGDDGRGER